MWQESPYQEVSLPSWPEGKIQSRRTASYISFRPWDLGLNGDVQGADLLFSMGTEASVREADGGGMAWDTPLCLPPTPVHAVKTNLGKKLSSIW